MEYRSSRSNCFDLSLSSCSESFVCEVVDPVCDVEDDEQDREGGSRISVDFVHVTHDRHPVAQRQRGSSSELGEHLAPTTVGQRRRLSPVGALLPRDRGRGRRRLGAGVVSAAGCCSRSVELAEQSEATVTQPDGCWRWRRGAAELMRMKMTWRVIVALWEVNSRQRSQLHRVRGLNTYDDGGDVND